jgi:O-antigen/teichoic acid export membrane protein
VQTDLEELKSPKSGQLSVRDRPSLFINAISTWGPLNVNLIIGFLLTPYLIAHLGKGNYGIWALVGSFLGYYGLLRLGVGAGLTRYLPFYIGRCDFKSASEIASTGLAIYSVVGVVIIGISIFAAETIARFYNAGPQLVSLVRIMGLAAAIECPMRILDGIVRARERWVVANCATVSTAIIRALGIASCVYFGYGLIEMGYVILAVTIFSMILFLIIFLKVCPLIQLRPRMVKFAHVQALVSFGLLSTIVTLAWRGSSQSQPGALAKICLFRRRE